MKKIMAFAALAAATMAIPTQSQAVVVLDQQSLLPTDISFNTGANAAAGVLDPTYVSGPYVGMDHSFVQTITAGTKGKLDHIDLSPSIFFGEGNPFSGSGELIISLIDGDYATGAREIVGQSSVDFQFFVTQKSITAPPEFTFDTRDFDYVVSAGQKFSLQVTAPAGLATFAVGIGTYDPASEIYTEFYSTNYQGGQLVQFVEKEDISDIYPGPADIVFATYVDVAGGVPEPATWAMMIFGFGAIGARLRQKKALAPALSH